VEELHTAKRKTHKNGVLFWCPVNHGSVGDSCTETQTDGIENPALIKGVGVINF
jgi:hypothetical protein